MAIIKSGAFNILDGNVESNAHFHIICSFGRRQMAVFAQRNEIKGGPLH